MTNNTLQKQIMKRVYYSFAVRLATHSMTLKALILVVAGYALASLVYVDMVLRNIASTPVSELGSKLVTIVSHADFLTLAVLGVAIFTALSLPLRSLRFNPAGKMSVAS